MPCFIIGVAGGSGSGKTTVAKHIADAIGDRDVAVIRQDSYYKDLSHLPLEDRRKIILDHPDAFDWELLKNQFLSLYYGLPIQMPTYDFATYVRYEETITVMPAPVVVFEGIFALMEKSLCDLMSLKIFVDTAADIRFIRRLKRDIVERGRTVESVIQQYLEFVRPMHQQFIESTKRISDIIIPHGANKAALEMIVARINAVIHNYELGNNNYFDEEV